MSFPTVRRELLAYHVTGPDTERVVDAADDIVRFDAELAALNLKDAAALALHQARREDLAHAGLARSA
ncbi:MAG: hypothetical protein EOM91_15540 [Sphingobacteriia bacterium]|nr:hypothetical protein [Sphingobacteriia bacterium]